MDQLLDVLRHPSRWSTVGGLAPAERALAALALIVLFSLGAALCGVLTARWMRRRRPDGDEPQVARLRRSSVVLVALIGFYLAFDVAPLPPRLAGLLSGVAYVIAALMAARVAVIVATLLVSSSVAHLGAGERDRLEREYVPLVRKLTTLAVALILVTVVAKHFGQDVTSLVAALGVGSLAIGLAAQQTLGNMIAGFTLLVDRPFRPGDRIKLASGESGEVVEIGVRSTRILMAERNLLIVPNTELANSRVVNFAFPSVAARGEVRVTVAYESDVARAAALLEAAAVEDSRVARAPEPQARLVALSASGAELAIGFEVGHHEEVLVVEAELRRRLLDRYAAEKIALGVPRTDVRLMDQRRSGA
jgi:small-conductance mechanosensitive channel